MTRLAPVSAAGGRHTLTLELEATMPTAGLGGHRSAHSPAVLTMNFHLTT